MSGRANRVIVAPAPTAGSDIQGRVRCDLARRAAEVDPLQHGRRDSAVAARHAIVAPAVNHEVCGQALPGRETRITPLIRPV